jgi:SSS family solute:Na+ symporter
VQRLLSAKNQGQSRAALFASWIVIFVQFTLFLTIGMLLWVYRHGQSASAQPDRCIRRLSGNRCPLVWRVGYGRDHRRCNGEFLGRAQCARIGNGGFYEPIFGVGAQRAGAAGALFGSRAQRTGTAGALPKSPHLPGHFLKVARVSTVFWGVVLGAIALVASQWGSVLESGLRIASVTLGILLGIVPAGRPDETPGENAAIAGVVAGLAAMLYVKFATEIPFTWWVMIGSAATFGAGYGASFAIPGATRRKGKGTE